MARATFLQGKVITGVGKGAGFTHLPWARSQCVERLAIDPYPGTLNLWLDDEAELRKWRRLRGEPGVRVEPPSREFCEAKGFPGLAAKGASHGQPKGERIAIIVPDVPDYPQAQVELIATVNLREALGLRDGDIVSVCVGV